MADTQKNRADLTYFCFGEKTGMKLSRPEILQDHENGQAEIRIGVNSEEGGYYVLGLLRSDEKIPITTIMRRNSKTTFEPVNESKVVKASKSISTLYLGKRSVHISVVFEDDSILEDTLECEIF